MKKIRFILFTIVGAVVLLYASSASIANAELSLPWEQSNVNASAAITPVPVTAAGSCATGKICNPLGTTTTLNQVLTIVISTVQVIAGILSVVYLILAGLKFVLAAGDPGKITKARAMLLYVVIGIAIIFGAQAISLVVQNTIKQVGSGQ